MKLVKHLSATLCEHFDDMRLKGHIKHSSATLGLKER